jgi:hypothetical protein
VANDVARHEHHREHRQGEPEEDRDAAAERDRLVVDLAVARLVDETQARGERAHDQRAEPRDGEAAAPRIRIA